MNVNAFSGNWRAWSRARLRAPESSEHVVSCTECQAIAAELTGNREVLASLNQDSLNEVSVPQEILPAVRAELDRELARVSVMPGSRKWRWVAAAAVVLAVSTAAWQFTRVSSVSGGKEAVVANAAPVIEIERAGTVECPAIERDCRSCRTGAGNVACDYSGIACVAATSAGRRGSARNDPDS